MIVGKATWQMQKPWYTLAAMQKKLSKLSTDANPVGLDAVLTDVQEGCKYVIASASESLTAVERRYS